MEFIHEVISTVGKDWPGIQTVPCRESCIAITPDLLVSKISSSTQVYSLDVPIYQIP
jgi:hypothetical protein